MAIHLLVPILALAIAAPGADEQPYGKGMTDANKERLVIEDGEDAADWYNGSPDETKLSADDRHAKAGSRAVLFANVVDHTKGETNYPIGWPRVGKDLGKLQFTDWSAYDFFECWIYCDTSRERLPASPLGVGFYHSGPKRSTNFRLPEVTKGQWVPVQIPVAKIERPDDVQRVQFNISEADYKHGDRVDFFIDDVVLTRFVDPAINEFAPERRLVYSSERQLRAAYSLVGYKGLEAVVVELAILGPDGTVLARATGSPSRQGEIIARIERPLAPGVCLARLSLRDGEGRLVDRRDAEFRVIAGPGL
ncbi:MAG: hypothetical protein KJZ87_17375 [Thermoguttaceae bacterium]|nr:hypothetical protein [Thermoguttaceae bacterium]